MIKKVILLCLIVSLGSLQASESENSTGSPRPTRSKKQLSPTNSGTNLSAAKKFEKRRSQEREKLEVVEVKV